MSKKVSQKTSSRPREEVWDLFWFCTSNSSYLVLLRPNYQKQRRLLLKNVQAKVKTRKIDTLVLVIRRNVVATVVVVNALGDTAALLSLASRVSGDSLLLLTTEKVGEETNVDRDVAEIEQLVLVLADNVVALVDVNLVVTAGGLAGAGGEGVGAGGVGVFLSVGAGVVEVVVGAGGEGVFLSVGVGGEGVGLSLGPGTVGVLLLGGVQVLVGLWWW